MIDTQLKDKVVLITGANHGIGAETARTFAREGAKVFITYLRTNPNYTIEETYRKELAKSGEAVIQEISSSGRVAEGWEADLSNPSVIPELFDRVEKAFGSVQILINNAAYCQADTFLSKEGETASAPSGHKSNTVSIESIDRHFAVNSRASALLIKEFSRRHVGRKGSWGRIISVSTDGDDCFPTEISYGASKAALVSYTRAAAVELGKFGITSNIVSLGAVQTGWMSEEVVKRESEIIPLKRVGQPSDVADVILFLASDQARWITGQKIYVGGGHRMM